MSLLAKHNVPFFGFFKKSVSFFFTKEFVDMMRAPLALSLIVCILGMNVVEKQTFEGMPIVSVNFGFFLSCIGTLFILCVSVMVETHRIVLQVRPNTKSLFGLRFGKTELKYVLLFIGAAICSVAVTAFWSIMFYAVCAYFFKVLLSVNVLFWVTLGVSPYFMVRFACAFPAVTTGDKVSLYRAWRMSHGLGSSLCLYYVFVASIPMFAGAVVTGALPFLEQIGIPEVAVTALSLYVTVLCMVLSGVAQAVYMSEFYAYLKEQKITNGFDDSFIFSVAKKKQTD